MVLQVFSLAIFLIRVTIVVVAIDLNFKLSNFVNVFRSLQGFFFINVQDHFELKSSVLVRLPHNHTHFSASVK